MEWQVLIIGGGILFTFIVAIIKPILALNTTLVKLDAAIESLQASFKNYESNNTTSHLAILDKLGGYDTTLVIHGERLTKVEASASAAHKRLDERGPS